MIGGLDLSLWQWVIVVFAALVVGFSKTAISGTVLLVVPVMAGIFGGKASTGILLTMLLIGDVFAVRYYHRHADWGKIARLMPFTVLGIVTGAITGKYMNDRQFLITIAISVLFCLGLLLYLERKGNDVKIPNGIVVSAIAGLLSGFTSMIGNAAAPIFSVYLLAMGFTKNNFMGTSAWFYLLLNALKMPFQIFLWHNITFAGFKLALVMIVPILIGATIGIFTLKRLNERVFRYIIMIMTAFAAVKLLIG
ncbi:MAG: uncharacterized protein PWQ12_1639 [Clostridiales bacterium]|jgi:hypothetical protein|nr:uncharacterized protein [Clostridiales bacterium]